DKPSRPSVVYCDLGLLSKRFENCSRRRTSRICVEVIPRSRSTLMEGLQMSAEKLLLWMAARRAGTWQQFRGAVESLHLPLSIDDNPASEDFDDGGLPDYQRLRLALERLGHAEFFANTCENGWRVAPPVLAISESDH